MSCPLPADTLPKVRPLPTPVRMAATRREPGVKRVRTCKIEGQTSAKAPALLREKTLVVIVVPVAHVIHVAFWLGIECRNRKHSHYQNLPILSSFSREACPGRIKYLPLLALSYSGIPAKELCYLCLWQITSKFIYARRGMRLRCQKDLFVPTIAPNT